jgi:ribosome-associated heat shock protein Hsp15
MANAETADRIRLDKWLWFARVVRTRVLARELVESRHVRVNGQRTDNPAKMVRAGDILTVALPSRARVLRVLDTAARRGPASEAELLYEELG